MRQSVKTVYTVPFISEMKIQNNENCDVKTNLPIGFLGGVVGGDLLFVATTLFTLFDLSDRGVARFTV